MISKQVETAIHWFYNEGNPYAFIFLVLIFLVVLMSKFIENRLVRVTVPWLGSLRSDHSVARIDEEMIP